MRYPMIILAGVAAGALLSGALVEHDKLADLVPMPDIFLPTSAADELPVPVIHKVHLSTLPMRDGAWAIEKKIVTGEE